MLALTPNTIFSDPNIFVGLLRSFPIDEILADLKTLSSTTVTAWKHLLGKEWELAIPSLSQLISSIPDEAVLYVLRGYAYAQINNVQSANSDLLKAVELDPNNVLVLTLLGFTQLAAGNFEE